MEIKLNNNLKYMHCPKCNHKLSSGSKFCTQCGNEIKIIEETLKDKKVREERIISIIFISTLFIPFIIFLVKIINNFNWGIFILELINLLFIIICLKHLIYTEDETDDYKNEKKYWYNKNISYYPLTTIIIFYGFFILLSGLLNSMTLLFLIPLLTAYFLFCYLLKLWNQWDNEINKNIIKKLFSYLIAISFLIILIFIAFLGK
ncbi:MAG: zinc-ribbon domain-containing protein [Patescibacteria group bacterium]|nr:zinc-ribbon domain-containing protein [Patescibacteria group bacterium]MDD4695256.1 zinc-ribbon domain-containing protein [Patescibacteria group bacterium]